MPETLIIHGPNENLTSQLRAEDAAVHDLQPMIVEAFGGQQPAKVIVKGVRFRWRFSVGLAATGKGGCINELPMRAAPLRKNMHRIQ